MAAAAAAAADGADGAAAVVVAVAAAVVAAVGALAGLERTACLQGGAPQCSLQWGPAAGGGVAGVCRCAGAVSWCDCLCVPAAAAAAAGAAGAAAGRTEGVERGKE